MLKKPEFYNKVFHKYNNIIDSISIGVETLDNYALKLLNKGSSVKDCLDVFEKIIKDNKDIKIIALVMKNLASKSKDDIIEGYNKLVNIKLKFKNTKIPFEILPIDLELYPEIEYTNDKHIKLLTHPSKILCKYERIGDDGKEIPPDKKIINKEIFKEIHSYINITTRI
jgi:ArsR family metal-binding transcriptional regulator